MKRFPLLWLSLHRRRRLIGALALGLIVFESLIILVAAAIPTDQLFAAKRVPSSFNAFSGSNGSISLASIPGLLGAGLLHPFWIALQLSAVASLGSAIVAADVEEGTIELVAVRPLARARILAERTAAVVVVSAGLAMAGILPLLVSNMFVGRIKDYVSATGIAVVGLSGFALTLAFTGIAVAASCIASRRSAVLGAVGGLAAVTYAANFIAEAWSSAKPLRFISPFHYYKPADALISGSIPWGDIAVLACVCVLGIGTGAIALRRRDLTR